MKLCIYARQQCKWPDRPCPREEELRPVFASSPEKALHQVWICGWAGSRIPAAAYRMHLMEERKLRQEMPR